MKKIKNSLVLRKDDYSILSTYLKVANLQKTFNRQDAENLQAELKKATLVNGDEFPIDVVGLNSKVRIKAGGAPGEMELMIVTPDKANIKERKISVMSPIGTALLGFREGQKVTWKVPSGNKTFTILKVVNDHNTNTA